MSNSGDLVLALEQRDAGDTVRVTIKRNDEERDVQVVLQAPR